MTIQEYTKNGKILYRVFVKIRDSTEYTKNGKLLYRVFVKIRDSTGKQITLQRSGITSEMEAHHVEFELRAQLKGRNQSYRWPKWLEACLEKIRINFRVSTLVNYETTLRKCTLPRWANCTIDEISQSEVHDLIFQVAGRYAAEYEKGSAQKV
jgi:hypothetical protein